MGLTFGERRGVRHHNSYCTPATSFLNSRLMEDVSKLTLQEKYRLAIESLMRFDFQRREADLRWMLAESRKPRMGLAWLKEKYYELLRKCEEHPVPFQVIYDLETIAARIFPRAARKFSFLRDPINGYFRTRLKYYDPDIRSLTTSETFHIRDLLAVLGAMGERDGRSMVAMFLAQMRAGSIHKSLASRLGPDQLSRLVRALEEIPPTADADDLPLLLQHAAEIDTTFDEGSEKSAGLDEAESFATTLNGSGLASEKTVLPDANVYANAFADDVGDSAMMPDQMESAAWSAEEIATAGANALGEESRVAQESSVDAQERSVALTAMPDSPKLHEQAPHDSDGFLDSNDSAGWQDSGDFDGLLDSEHSNMPEGLDSDGFEEPSPVPGIDDDVENLSLTNDLLSGQDAYVDAYQGDFHGDAEPDDLHQTLSDQESRDLRSDAAYKEFLLEQSERVLTRKDQILELSGLSAQIDRALELREEQNSVELLAELHPLAFLTEQERILRGLDRIESPLGKIMAHLSAMYRKLNIPDMRAYVDYYTLQLEEAGLFDSFPTIRERLLNYRNSLVDPPPELLKQVHMGLQKIEDSLENDHRKCIESQVHFLHECLENEVFHRVWPTIAVILENLIKAELLALGENIQVSPWRNRLSAEERTKPRALPVILSDVEPESSEGIAALLSQHMKHAAPGVRGGSVRPNFLANRSGDPQKDATRMQASLLDLFSEDSQAAMELSGEILNGSEYSALERETTLRVLQRQEPAPAAELFHFDQFVRSAGGTEEQRECAESLRGGVSSQLIDARISSINLDHAQNGSMQRLSQFLATRDTSSKFRIFQEIVKDHHIPEGMKTLFRKSAAAGEFENYLESITTSNLSSANKLKLLRVLKQVAVHRNWLSPSSEARINNKILFYERILAADQAREAIVAKRHSFYRNHRDEIKQALMEGRAKSIRAMFKNDSADPVSSTHLRNEAVKQDEAEKAIEESHHHGFSDEFLEELIQNRMRAARWYTRLPEGSREQLHKQAEFPGKAQVLVHQIEKDNAFKKALRHLKKPVDPALLETLSAQYPEPEYQSRLKEFRTPVRASSGVLAVASSSQAGASGKSSEESASLLDASFDRMVENVVRSNQNFEELPLVSIEDDESRPSHAESSRRAPPQAHTSHDHATMPAHASESDAGRNVRDKHPDHEGHDQHHKRAEHHNKGVEHHHREDHGPRASAAPGIASTLARGLSNLFSKATPASRSNTNKQAAHPSGPSAKAKEKNSGPKKTQKAAADLMKGIKGYSRGEVYLSEKDHKALEKDMEKHPESRKLMDDHSYLFKVDHPDPAQFQPPIFVIIPEMKALNHDPSKKKAAMQKIEQAMSGAPAKKKAHLQALLTFMERYKTK